MLLFVDFEWDNNNIEHLLKHNVMSAEVEEVCLNNPYIRRTADKRYLAYGKTDSGRHLFIVGINKGRGVFRTITARDMTDREKSLHKRRFGK